MNAYSYLLWLSLGVLLLQFFLIYRLQRVSYRLARIEKDVARRTDNMFRQMEALEGIRLDLDLHKSLPATRNWAASPDFLMQLVRHALDAAPEVVLECGSGVSTLILARCAQVNGRGHVYSLEHQPQYAQVTRADLERHGLSAWATVLDAPLRSHVVNGDTWMWYSEEAVPRELSLDMLVIDGPPRKTGPLARYPAGPALFHRLGAKGMIFLDDADRASERATISRWMREFANLRHEFIDCEKGCARLWMG